MIPGTLIDRTPPGDEMRHRHLQPRPPDRRASNPKKNARAEGRVDGDAEVAEEAAESGRERLKRHRMEMGGQVWIPEIWGQESLLEDWIDGSVFDRPLVPKGLTSAREALVHGCRQTTSAACRIKNRC
ncbi:protein BIC1-like [Curcuma longa]|uniref:protein BIC1-like n=1 Tax=Curcuma longa TaxID=136217 RepID=UPI003D9EA4C8